MKTKIVSIISTVFLGFLSCVALTACHHQSDITITQVTQASQSDNLLANLQENNVQVIQQGSRLQLILPVDNFFKPATREVISEQVPTLNTIALYLHQYVRRYHARYPIKVYAYTDKVPMRADRYAYSRQYAQVIAAYLWNRGFTTHELSVVGFGARYPIASQRTPAGAAYNRRVMIQVN